MLADCRLIESVKKGCVNDLREAFDAGATLCARDVGGRSALEVAHLFGEPDPASYLLARGACPNKRINKRRDTLLHLAARAGDIGLTVVLLEDGGDPNLTNHAGQTPLYLAVRAGLACIARELLDSGADPNLAEKHGNSPLYLQQETVTLPFFECFFGVAPTQMRGTKKARRRLRSPPPKESRKR
jgi:hypothetical protein